MSAAKLHADFQFWGKVLLTAGVILWAMSLLMAARDIAEERRGLDIAGWLPALLSFIILGVVAALMGSHCADSRRTRRLLEFYVS